MLRNLTGAFTAIVFFSTQIPPRRVFLLRTTSVSLLLVLIYPLITSLADEHYARLKFPILSNFQSSLEISRWSGNADFKIKALPNSVSEKALRITLIRAPYSGVFLSYFSGNWSNFNYFSFEVYNYSGESQILNCRINDTQHINRGQEYRDRFNKSFVLKEGLNKISIPIQEIAYAPAGREMDIQNISFVGFFSVNPVGGEIFYIDNVMLLP